MKKIGLTGGIGSGKSTVAAVFRNLGVPVFVSDDEARNLQDEDPAVKKAIAALLGADVYANGKLDRAKVAAQVFSDKKKLDALNAIVHPAVGKAFAAFCEAHRDAAFVLKEAAIIFEIGLEKELDGVITVAAPDELRIERVMQRDHISREAVEQRMKNQLPQEEKIKRSDFVIVNDGKELVLPQVMEVMGRI